MAVQQLYVRLKQFQETLATILQEARNEPVGQVQNATSTTTHEEPMIRADRLFKLRSYLGAVDQRNELEPATTEESSTPRLNMALSMQMYYTLVMMKTLYRCRNASVSEEFAGRRQFVRESEPRFVVLLRNVLSCRRKDDIPTQPPVDVAHESQSSETDRRHHDRCECAEDGGRTSRGLSHPERYKHQELDADAKGNPRDHENTTVL